MRFICFTFFISFFHISFVCQPKRRRFNLIKKIKGKKSRHSWIYLGEFLFSNSFCLSVLQLSLSQQVVTTIYDDCRKWQLGKHNKRKSYEEIPKIQKWWSKFLFLKHSCLLNVMYIQSYFRLVSPSSHWWM